MPFEPTAVISSGSNGNHRLRAAVQADGSPAWEPGDSNPKIWPARGLGSCHGAIGNQRVHLGIEARLFLTDSRLVVISRDFAKGTRHSGPIISSAIQNKVSQARAEREAAGQFLVGQMRHPWVNMVAFSVRDGRRGHNAIRVCGTHKTAFGDHETVMLLIYLDTYTDPRPIAAEIATRVVADRYSWATTTEAARESLAGARFTEPGQIPAGTLPCVRLPGAYIASAGSSGQGVYSSLSCGPAPA